VKGVPVVALGVDNIESDRTQKGATMPIDVRNINAHEFIKTTAEGELDLEASKRMLVQIAAASAPSDDYDILLDTRGAHSVLSVHDLWDIVDELHQYREALTRKTAVLVPVERAHYGEYFADCAREKGYQVSAFTSLGDAMAWLIEA
jgi:hypothetical protein